MLTKHLIRSLLDNCAVDVTNFFGCSECLYELNNLPFFCVRQAIDFFNEFYSIHIVQYGDILGFCNLKRKHASPDQCAVTSFLS